MLYMPLFPTAFAHYYICKIYSGGLIWQELLLCSILYDYGTFLSILVLVDIWIISSLGLLHISGMPDVCDPSMGQFYTTLLDNPVILINV